MQLLAAAMARARGLDPDRPRNLTRSVILAPRLSTVILVVCLNPALDITHHVPARGLGRGEPARRGARPARRQGAQRGQDAARARRGGAGHRAGRRGHRDAVCGPRSASWGCRRPSPRSPARPGGPSPSSTAAGTAPRCSTSRGRRSAGRVRRGSAPGTKAPWPGAAAVVLSGSLPPGLPPGTYAELIALAAAAGVPAVLDTHGEALLRGAAAGPAIVKPNLAELEALAGRPLSDCPRRGPAAPWPSPPRSSQAAGAAGGGGHAAARRPAGATTDDGSWLAGPPAAVAGNPTGPATRWPRAWRTGWCWAARGRSGCGTRSRWARPPRPRPSPGSSATPTTPGRWPGSP